MSSEFLVPELGEGIYEAELVEWRVAPGDAVTRGQSLAEVITDKASMELPSPFAGTIVSLDAEPGREIKVGEVILSYTPAGADDGDGRQAAGTEKLAAEAAPRREPLEAAAGAVPGRRAASGRSAGPVRRPAPRADANGGRATVRRVPRPQAAPSVRRMARSLGVDLSTVRGSGPGGRILIDDLTEHVKRLAPPAGETPPDHPAGGAQPARTAQVADVGTAGTRMPFHGLRRKIAEQMVRSKRTIPHYSYMDECDVTELVRLRSSLRETFARRGINLTYLPFFVKAAVAALKEVPLANSTLDEQAEEIVLHDEYHIGIAATTPRGLMVPVLHHADHLDLFETAREIDRLAANARAGRARLEDLQGGTFTITSIGGIGGLMATPVVNYPEAGVLALGKIVKRPVYDDAGHIRPAEVIYLSLSFDHRIVDGAVCAVFANAVMEKLQNPATLLVE